MNKYLKILLISSFSFFLIIFISGFIYINEERSFVYVEDLNLNSENYSENLSTNNSKKIGLIGDSWVAYQKLDKYISTSFSKRGIDVEVESIGFPGSKSKEILEQFQSKEVMSLLKDKSIEYIVIIAGVNDSSGHIGRDYYAHHMNEMVKLINNHGKTPYILELPEYGIEEPEPILPSLKHGFYRYLFDSGEKDVINAYRSELKQVLNDDDYKLISFNNITNDYHQNSQLYKDFAHLNEKGNKVLSEEIVKVIYNP